MQLSMLYIFDDNEIDRQKLQYYFLS